MVGECDTCEHRFKCFTNKSKAGRNAFMEDREGVPRRVEQVRTNIANTCDICKYAANLSASTKVGHCTKHLALVYRLGTCDDFEPLKDSKTRRESMVKGLLKNDVLHTFRTPLHERYSVYCYKTDLLHTLLSGKDINRFNEWAIDYNKRSNYHQIDEINEDDL